VFADMLTVSTKGGPIALPESCHVIRLVLNNITHATTTSSGDSLETLIAAYELAKRLDMIGAMAKIKEGMHGCDDWLHLLSFACSQDPIDRPLCRIALSHFEDQMRYDPGSFRSFTFESDRRAGLPRLASTAPQNLTFKFAESLTTAGYIAYSRAWEDSQVHEAVCRRRVDGAE
jgi:hypothetical protein